MFESGNIKIFEMVYDVLLVMTHVLHMFTMYSS